MGLWVTEAVRRRGTSVPSWKVTPATTLGNWVSPFSLRQVLAAAKPAPLVPGGGPDLVEGLPEAERPVADRNLGRDGEAAGLRIDEKLAPALRALPDTNLRRDELLPVLGRGADEDEHAFGVILHSGLQVDAIGPDIEVTPGREVAPLPTLILGLPFGREAGDDGG